MKFTAYGVKNLPVSNIDTNGVYFVKGDGEQKFQMYIRKADNSAWVHLGITDQIESVNGLTGGGVQLDLTFSNGKLSITGGVGQIDLDARYIKLSDNIEWSKIISRPTTLAGYGITDAAKDNEVVKLTGTQTIAGSKTFSSAVTVAAASSANHAVRKTQMDTAIQGLQGQINVLQGTVNSGLQFKGEISASSNPNYPAATTGDMYVVSSSGKIGGASGIQVEVGSTLICKETSVAGAQAAVGSKWVVLQPDLDQATESKAGFAKIATQGEVDAGTDDLTIVTPRKLDTKLNVVRENIILGAENTYVRYSSAQTLNSTQKATARGNIEAAKDSDVVKLTGTQTIAGSKTFSSAVTVPSASSANHAVNLTQLNSVTEGKFVKFDANQSLTSGQKTNARGNIDAASKDDVNWGVKEW